MTPCSCMKESTIKVIANTSTKMVLISKLIILEGKQQGKVEQYELFMSHWYHWSPLIKRFLSILH